MRMINVSKAGGMNWVAKISLVLIFTLMFSVFMHDGLYQPKGAEAAIGTTTAWTSLGSTYHTATKTPTVNIAISGTASTNRVLAVAVTFVGNAAQTATCAVTYGGTTLLPAAGDASGTSSLDHTWIFYLPENNTLMDGTSRALATTVTSTATAIMTDAYYIVLNGVDQSNPLGSSARPNVNRTAISGTAVTMVAGSGFLLNANEQAIAIIGSARSASTTAVTVTTPTGWTLGTSQNSTVTNSNRSYVHTKAIPSTNQAEDLLPATASSSNCVTSETAVSFRPSVSAITTTLATGSMGTGANATVYQMDTNKPVGSFTLSASGGPDTVTGLTVSGTNLSTTNIATSGVKIWADTNGNGQLDAGEITSPIASQSIVGSTAVFTGLSLSIGSGSTNSYIITYDIGATPTNTNPLTAYLSAFTPGGNTAGTDSADSTLTISTNRTTAGTATATAMGANMINVVMPYTLDTDGNGTYTVDYGPSASGPWTNVVTGAAHVATPYRNIITGLAPGTYYVQATYVDGPGVAGTNPQIIGPITLSTSQWTVLNDTNPNSLTLTGGSGNNGRTQYTYTAPSGINRLAVVAVQISNGGTVTTAANGFTVSMGGVAFTKIAATDDAVAYRTGLYVGYIKDVNIPSGANNVDVTVSNATALTSYKVMIQTYMNVNQSTLLSGTAAYNSATSSSATSTAISIPGTGTYASGDQPIFVMGQSVSEASIASYASTPTGVYTIFNNGIFNSVNAGALAVCDRTVPLASGQDTAVTVTWASSGRPAEVGAVLTGAPVTTAVGNGASEPSNVSLVPGGAATMLDAFTLQTSTGTNAVTDVTVTLGGTNSYQGVGLVEITSDDGSTVYGSASGLASNTVTVDTSAGGLTATASAVQYKVRITPKSHAAMPVPPGATYSVTGTVTGITCSNNHVFYDSASATVTIDNASPATPSAITGSQASGSVTLNWTNAADADYAQAVVLRSTATITDVPAEGAAYNVSDTLTNGAIVACVVASPTATCTDTNVVDLTTYNYMIFSKDANGNYAIGDDAGTYTPGAVMLMTTVGNGTSEPGDASLAPGGAATMLDAFTLQSSSGTDAVALVTVALAPAGAFNNLGSIAITSDDGGTVYGSASPSSNTVAVTTTGLTSTDTLVQYKVRITPKSHAAMPAVPGASYAVTGRVTEIDCTNPPAYSDSGSSTVTIDNASPANPTGFSGIASDTQVALSWTNPADTDYAQAVVLRSTAAITDVPAEGSGYSAGNTIGASTVACVVDSPTATCNATGLTNDTPYYFKVFAKDSSGNYSSGGLAAGPYKPNKIQPLTAWTNIYNGNGGGVTNVNQTSSSTFNADGVTATNRILLVGFTAANGTTGNTWSAISVTYGGVAVHEITGTEATANRSLSWMGYLLDSEIPSGANSVVVTLTSGAAITDLKMYAASYSNVDQLAPTGANASNTGGAATTTAISNLAYPAWGQLVLMSNTQSTTATSVTYNPTSYSTASGTLLSTPAASSVVAQRAVPSAVGSDATTQLTWAASARNSIVAVVLAPATGPKPTVVTVSPNVIGQGATRNITITGTNYVSGATVTISGTLVTASNVAVAGDGLSLTADITATTGAATGARNITITNPDTGAGTGTGVLTVNAMPTVSSASPNTTVAGTTNLDVTVTGTGFQNGAVAAFSDSGITVNSTVWNSATSLTVNINAPNVGAGNTITVTNPDGGVSVAGGSFTVTGPLPTVSGINPAVIGQNGTRTGVVITGMNFVTSAAVTFSGSGVSSSGCNVDSDTQITCSVSATAGATTGALDVTVTNSDTGVGTGTGLLTVNARPTVSSASPIKASAGTIALDVTVTGTGFQNGATAVFSGSGITVNSTVWNSATSLTVNIDAASAGAGRTITVTNPDGGVSAPGGSFAVTDPLPTVSNINPAAIGQGATRTGVIITGTNFVTGAAVSFSGSGVTSSSCNVDGGSQITCSVAATAGAATGARDVTVTNTDTGAGTGTGLLTVHASPTVSSASPAGGVVDSTIDVTINGANFLNGAMTSFGPNSGITVNGSANFVNATQVRQNISIAADATPGMRTVTVTNPDNGVGSGNVFTVNARLGSTITTCTGCHGNPPVDSPTRDANAGTFPGSHSATTHNASACTACHVDAGTNMGHRNGLIEMSTSMNYSKGNSFAQSNAAFSGGTCSNVAGCHTSSGPASSPSIGWGSSDCTSCHNTTQLILHGPLNNGTNTRRAVVAEFALASSHKRSASGAVSKYDCIVCHMEGDMSTGGRTAVHGDGYVNLRDPDTGLNIKGVTFDGGTPGSYVSTATDAAPSRFSRNLSSATIEADTAAIQINQCLKCHDANGALSASAQVPGGSAAKPFATTIAGAGYTGSGITANGVLGGVTDINAAFATTNNSYHPVRGKQNNSYAAGTRMVTPWNGVTKTAGTTTGWGPLITCFDCHAPAGASGTQTSTVIAHGGAVTAPNSVPLRGYYTRTGTPSANPMTLCIVCHAGYDTSTSSHHGTGSALASNTNSGMSTYLRYACNYCHSSATTKPARPTPGTDLHGWNKMATGATAWPSGMPPYAFMRNTVNWGTSSPKVLSGPGVTTGTATCGGSGKTSSGCTGENMSSYTPGGAY